MQASVSALTAITQLILLSLTAYQLTIALFGLRPYRRADGAAARPPRFLLLTCAHDEASVIAEHVRNLRALDYPRDAFDIVVVADNCGDRTAEVARAAGAQVWERTDTSHRGKGYALRWALHSRASLSEYDAVCVFDADNVVQSNFLRVMAAELASGHRASQAYLDTKNPWDTWVSGAYAGAYWYMGRFWQWARVSLGLSGALGGTGFCLATSLLAQVPWDAGSLTEDLEYTSRLILHGERVFWTAQTRVFDEKPLTYRQTVPQRTRWLRGHWTVAVTHTLPLLRAARAASGRRRWQVLDHLLYLWQPAVILATGVNIALSVAQVAFGASWPAPWLATWLPDPVWALLVAVGVFIPLVAYAYEDVPWRTWAAYPGFLLFNLTWVPIAAVALATRRNTAWSHTRHVRALRLDEVDPAAMTVDRLAL